MKVQHYDGEWIDCVREDLYDGTNDAVLQQPAVFETIGQATAFIVDICDLMHMGGDPSLFRVVYDMAGATHVVAEATV